MARATIKFKATGVGGGRMSSRKPNAPRVARLGEGRVTTNGRSKA
jgi:hypothetical protein